MKASKAVVKQQKQVRKRGLRFTNYISFPQTLRDAIPGPELPGCARLLILSSIDGSCANDPFFGQRVRLNFLAQESGKLKGSFEIGLYLQPEAAQALAKTLGDLVERLKSTPLL